MNIFYYDTEKNIYLTQLDAVAAKKTGKNIFFYYYDKEFSQIDWTIEPLEPLEQLYKERAQKIRDENEYLILCYSGGVDSTNILETFYYNNIHIDELIMVGAFSQDSYKGSDENHNGDVYHNCQNTLKNMNLPNTKLSYYDYTEWFNNPNNFSLIREYGNEWTKYIGAWKSVHHLWWHDLKTFVGKNNKKQSAYIMGSDKPEYFNYPKPHFKISDLSFNDYGSLYNNENFKRVNFYTDPDPIAIKIMAKQNHIINRSIINLNKNSQFSLLVGSKEKVIAKLIYNLKTPLIFKSKKSFTTSISSRDMYMLKNQNSDMYNMFLEGLQTIKKYGPVTGSMSFDSKSYYLE